jgi:ADP-heptose:LPS heptosyltransferase
MKILLIRNDNIGDLACITPLIQVLRKAYPEATIDFLGNSYNIDLVRHDPRLSRLWYYEKAKHVQGVRKKFYALIQKGLILCQLFIQQYDILIITVPIFNKRTLLLARWIRPKIIYGAASQDHRLPSNYQSVRIFPQQSHVLQVYSYARALEIKESVPEKMSLFLSPEEKKSILRERSLIPGESTLPIIGVQISARRPKQRWSLEQWKIFLEALLPYARIRLLWSPGPTTASRHPGDDELAKQLASRFCKENLLIKPTTNLRSLMVAFSTCDLVVGSDGGAMHIAAALDVVTVTLFGDIDPRIWKPYSEKGIVITSPTDTLADLDPLLVAKKVIEIIQNSFRI